jgi:translation initiation factor IF-2
MHPYDSRMGAPATSFVSSAQKLLLESPPVGSFVSNPAASTPTSPIHTDIKSNKVPIVIKADSSSSIEAIVAAIKEITVNDDAEGTAAINNAKRFDVVYSGVGDISSADLVLVTGSSTSTPGVVIGYNVGCVGSSVITMARNKEVTLLLSGIIYELVQDLQDLLAAQNLAPALPGTLLGRASVLKVFNIGKTSKVAGCSVKEGMFVMPGSLEAVPGKVVKVRVLRNKKEVIFVGELASLRIEKKTVTEVPAGTECGISVKSFSDILEGDIIECFETEDDLGLSTR